jgi:hypothetical protein
LIAPFGQAFWQVGAQYSPLNTGMQSESALHDVSYVERSMFTHALVPGGAALAPLAQGQQRALHTAAA